jgi:uncharacterized protein YjbI with pentapeptide repeats
VKRARILDLHFALAVLFLATLACRSYGRIDTDLLEPDDLSGQNFSGMAIVGYDLSNKNLRNVNFNGANLENTDFSNSDLTGVSFRRTTLVGADFTNAKLDERWIPIIDLLTTRHGAGQDFQGVDLSHTYLPAADLSGANLRGADLSSASLPSANLSNADLTGANLQGTDLSGADLRNADLTDAKLNRVNLSNATLTEAIVPSKQLWTTLRTAMLSCTRMPDGTIHYKRDCQGTPPP